VVSAIFPVVAPAGTVAITRLSFWNAKLAPTPLNVTDVAPVKRFPLIVTEVPTAPLEGEKLLIVGAFPEDTVKFDELVAVPDGVVSEILPVVAPAGTVAFTWALEMKLKVAEVPLNRTALTPVKLEPLIATWVPGVPDVGVNPEIEGPEACTTKSFALTPVPSEVVTLIFPVVAPNGTVADRCWSSDTLKVVGTAPKATDDTPEPPKNPLPVTDTMAPGDPLDGLNDETVGPAPASAGTVGTASRAIPTIAATAPPFHERMFDSISIPPGSRPRDRRHGRSAIHRRSVRTSWNSP
jgi:hypothetical protein